MTAQQRLTRHQPIRARFTAEEFMALCQRPPISEWVGKIELIDGEITRMSPANIPHWQVQQDLVADLRAIFLRLEQGWKVGSEPTVRFATGTVRLPDIGVFSGSKRKSSIFDVADLFLAVEVADTTLRIDLGPKRGMYAKAGVPHYWVIDVNGRKTHVMADPTDDDYAIKAIVPFLTPIAVPATGSSVTLT